MSRYYKNIKIFSDHYNIDGRDYTRVSEVLNIINKPYLNTWRVSKGKKESDRISKEAIDIGNQVHKALEQSIKIKLKQPFKLVEIFTPEADKIVNKALKDYKKWQRKTGFKPLQTELTVHSDCYNYAGTLDCVGTINDEIAIIDWKTSKRINKEHYLQVAAYADAYCEMTGKFPTHLYILRFTKTKKSKFEPIKLTEGERIKCFDLFENALNLWHYFNNNIKHNDTEDRVDKWKSREGIHYAKKRGKNNE